MFRFFKLAKRYLKSFPGIKKQKRINPRQKINFRKTNINNKISQSSSSSLKGLRFVIETYPM